jgi:arylsulfatase A-like enzyme
MTSTLPPTNGVHYNEGFYLDDSARSLAEVLEDAGYSTGAIVGAVVLDSINGIAQGFGHYDDDFGEFAAYLPHVKVRESQLSYTQRRADEITDLALELVPSLTEKGPFFLFLHYFDPHSPYDPPPRYTRADHSLDEGSDEIVIQRYDGEVAYTDEQIGRLLNSLEELGMIRNTLVVLTSDHGEGLGEHGEKTHGYFTYEGTLQVPLIFSMPGKVPQGEVYSGLFRLIDIAPTVTDILGIEGRGNLEFQGKSLFPFDGGEGVEVSYFESAMTYIVFNWVALRGVRSREWKYISAPREELYDLVTDPLEGNNLVDQMPQVADSLREIMEEIITSTEIYRGDVAGQEMSAWKENAVNPALVEKLGALGYIQAPEGIHSGYEAMFDRSLPDPKDRMEAHSHEQFVMEQLGIAIHLIQEGNYDECIPLLERLGDEGEEGWLVHYYLGLAYMGKLNNQRAEEELRTALDRAPIGPGRVKIRDSLRYLESRR